MQKSFYRDSNINSKALMCLLAVATIGVCLYLTNHFYQVKFPEGLGGGSLCDINAFFNCDAATHSKASSLFGAPISVFGLMIGILVLFGFMFQSPKFESALNMILAANALGCLTLFVYSLVALGSLCPFCTVYYLLSLGMLAVMWKKSTFGAPNLPALAVTGLVFLLAGAGASAYTSKKESGQAQLAVSLISQYDQYTKLSPPQILSPHSIAMATEKFEDAPIQLIVFSDFQCPACKALSEMMHPLSKRYQGKINILYYFFPLDSACNPDMTMPLHPLACTFAYVAHCAGDKFVETHDEIFEKQDKLSQELAKTMAKNLGVEECVASPETKAKVVELISQGKQYTLRSTPTMILNGVKIEGGLPLNQFYILMDELVKRHGSR